MIAVLLAALMLGGCVGRPEPDPAVQRASAPPWDAPRDAISYIRAADLPELPLGDDTDPYILTLRVTAAGQEVEVPAYIGVDRLRAVQAPVHTHSPGGEVWLEGEGNREATLGQFFTLWGVALTPECLGSVCGGVTVLADGAPVAEPASLVLRGVGVVEVVAG